MSDAIYQSLNYSVFTVSKREVISGNIIVKGRLRGYQSRIPLELPQTIVPHLKNWRAAQYERLQRNCSV